ncbi:MORN repeat-containing protein 5-like isoform X2 [Aricia agestis]|uniref:MORN repeat-containing protein 5-like isoform X2 n=1 Tax=Aricia agestis TaxID=91739 RepID=UPI001C207064|nr:MORN repeat-containing protein 5-like isoform X2 [Aricia agestis]
MSIEERRKRSEVYSLAIPRVERSEKRFPTGSTYCGTWDVLGMSGDVKYTFPNGAIYQGQFEDGMFHGEGILKYPSGIKLRTKWKRGELVEKTLVYSDGSEYKPDSSYCVLPDRRFTIELDNGLQPAGKSYLTAEQPTREIPLGYYDTGDGFYNPNSKMIHKSDNIYGILRAPSEYEQKWIVENCRKSPMLPVGPRKDLYEEWVEPPQVLKRCKCACPNCIQE